MATPQLVTVRDFSTSPYSQLADNLDTPLTEILARAESAIQTRLRRKLGVTAYTERFRATSSTIFTKHRPIVSVTLLRVRWGKSFPWETLDTSDLLIESEPGYIESDVALRGREIELTYTAGYAELPEVLRQAILMQAVMFAYQDLEVYGSGDGRTPGILYMNDHIDSLIAPFKQSSTVWH
jgi:hypothetical protein